MNQARAFCIEGGLAMRIGAGGFHADIRQHLGNQDNDLTQNMRGLLNDRSDDLAYLENRVKALSAKIEAIAKEAETICRLLTIRGIGPLGATALVAAAGDGKQFRKARDMAAWLGLVPAEYSTGGKQTLLGIVARGNGYVRRLIIHGARSCFLQQSPTATLQFCLINREMRHFYIADVRHSNFAATASIPIMMVMLNYGPNWPEAAYLGVIWNNY